MSHLTHIDIYNWDDEKKIRVFRGSAKADLSDASLRKEVPRNEAEDCEYKISNKNTENGITLTNQIIHGDLCGNILFHETLSPVVIDFSLDYRPREYAEAILIADSIAWENG